MDLSGTQQGELPMAMHAAASPYGAAGVTAVGHVAQLHRDHGNSNSGHQSLALPPPPPPAAAAGAGSGVPVLKYMECQKNHAAAMGGYATDGCGEFMPSGEEGSLEALKCAACGCHRSFHHKPDDADGSGYGHRAGRGLIAPAMPHRNGGGGVLVTAEPYGAMRAEPQGHPVQHQIMNAVPLSAVRASESVQMGAAARGSGSSSKKRFRTRFTAEQKARMLEFARRVGWRLPKPEDAMVQSFCEEIGVNRRVLKVWMHNNKYNLATNRVQAPPMPARASPPPPPQPRQMSTPPSSPQPVGPSLNFGGTSSPPPPQPLQMATPMMPSPPPSPQPVGPSFHLGGPSSPPPAQLPQVPMLLPPPPPSPLP